MTTLTRALILVVIAGAGLSVYFFFFYAPQPVQAFDAILNLTPGDLELHCGVPVEDTLGVVADGAGIRDLRYNASGNSEIVFRFISADDKQWESLGAWEKVRAPDFLGSPVDAQEVGRAMDCAAKEDSQSLLPPWSVQRGVGGLAPELAFVSPQAFGEMMQAQHQGPLPMPSTLPRNAVTSSPQTTNSGPAVIHVPETEWSQAPRAYYGSDDDDLPRFRNGPRCPAGTGACEMLDYPEFVEALKQVIVAERQGEFQAAAEKLTQHGTLMVRLPANEQSRIEAIQNVVRLEVKAFNVVEDRLREDVTRLDPSQGDTADKAAKKVAEMRRDDNLRRVLWSHAVEANGPGRALSAKGDAMRFDGRAYERMVQIAVSGEWR